MTDMLDLITLFAGIGIGWLMGRTITKPQRGQEGTQEATESPQIDQEGSTRGNGRTNIEAARTAHRAAEGHACSHHWQDTGNPGTRRQDAAQRRELDRRERQARIQQLERELGIGDSQ